MRIGKHRSVGQRIWTIAGFGFVGAILATQWLSPSVGFAISLIVGFGSLLLRVIASGVPKYHWQAVLIYKIGCVVGFLLTFDAFFLSHRPYMVVGFLGLQAAQWILLFFT